MAEAPEQYKRPVQPDPKLNKDVVGTLLREKSNHVIITRVEDRKKRKEKSVGNSLASQKLTG